MPIRFLPNDPLAIALLPPRVQPPRPDGNGPQVGFKYTDAAAGIAEAVYPIESGEFRFWQCREAALATLEAWATLAPLPRVWQTGQRLLPLLHDAGPGLNAHYDRTAVAFYGWETPGRNTYPAASTDAVAHEVGHALLDAVHPELWESVYPEPAAFHEAFADCLALLVSLFDAATRQALLQGGGQLRVANFVEALAEDVAEGVRVENPNDPQSAPRHALNTFQWDIPVNLPPAGFPATLTSEPHSFSRVFTGCFYDTLCNIFAAQPARDDQGLLAAAQTAGRLLIAGAQGAPEVPRFFQAVGRAMVLADETASGGAHHAAIRDAFADHQIAIGSTVMLAPTSGLAGPAPAVNAAAGTASLPAAARRDLLARISAPRGRLTVTAHEVGGQAVAKAVHRRRIALGTLDRRLKGVVAPAAESVLLGASAARAVVLGHLPNAHTTVDEVRHFVGTLLEHGGIAVAAAKRASARKAPAAPYGPFLPTHRVQTRGGQRVLQRVRFTCGAATTGREVPR
jgi:hypothetical protein